jgi:5'-3' exonuclease
MGIPYYFRLIINDYPNVLKQSIHHTSHLFLDFNSLIHPCCQKVLKEYSNKPKISMERLEQKFLTEIDNYLSYVCKYVKPTDLLYIAIDGPAPAAKMVQQRNRRFRSVKYKKLAKPIKERFGNTSLNEWDTNAITPGTKFMDLLSTYLNNQFETKDVYKNIPKIILSDSNDPGEGEHKILEYLRTTKISEQKKYVIYGLDADLIMLSLCSNVENIYLLREDVAFGKVDMGKLLYFDVNKFKNIFINDLLKGFTGKYKEFLEGYKTHLIQDYIFLCFLIGNDFLPRLPGLNIRNNSLEVLIKLYKELLLEKEEFLVIDGEINFSFLKTLFIKLSKTEKEDIISITKKYYKRRFYTNNCNDNYSIEMKKIDCMPVVKKHTNFIDPGKPNWKRRYYYHFFDIDNKDKNQKNVQEICKKYISGLIWNTQYYFKGCCSWEWHYPYTQAPLLEDILLNFESSITGSFKNDVSDPVDPVEQLLCVLPPQSSHLLPTKYKFLMNDESPIGCYYPLDVELEQYLGYYFHDCEPKLLPISFRKIKKYYLEQ